MWNKKRISYYSQISKLSINLYLSNTRYQDQLQRIVMLINVFDLHQEKVISFEECLISYW